MDWIVSNLNDAGQGSLRWAIGEANANPGFDQIEVAASLSAGTIELSSSLEIIREQISINGLIGDDGSPEVAVDFNGHDGLKFSGRNASGSTLTGFALIDAGGDGLTLDASAITVQNTYIGVDLDGVTGIANRGNGVLITKKSHNNMIGSLDPLTGRPQAQQLSNLISGNKESGILVKGSKRNRIANNRIGTTADGTEDLGNGRHGIHLKAKAKHNKIGGTAHQGNDPTNNEFARPEQGNLISGNDGHGVLINSKSRKNQLLGNFIGTNSDGNSAIGNNGDGVAIINADHNSLLGTTRNQSPFIYYNVVSGNGQNGLRVRNSDHIKIHANFFGIGADNSTIVSNQGDGVLVEGDSKNTIHGGVIPLGNVNAGNQGNGISVTDEVSGFISFNTFAGLTAFGDSAGNQKSGIFVSSSGGNTRIRTNVLSGNKMHGLHISGQAKDVWVDPNIIGLSTNGLTGASSSNPPISWANLIDGIRIDDQAHGIKISGSRKSVIPQNTISNNDGYGIRILDQASDIKINNLYLGINVNGKKAFENKKGGIFSGPEVSKLIIGPKVQETPIESSDQLISYTVDFVDAMNNALDKTIKITDKAETYCATSTSISSDGGCNGIQVDSNKKDPGENNFCKSYIDLMHSQFIKNAASVAGYKIYDSTKEGSDLQKYMQYIIGTTGYWETAAASKQASEFLLKPGCEQNDDDHAVKLWREGTPKEGDYKDQQKKNDNDNGHNSSFAALTSTFGDLMLGLVSTAAGKVPVFGTNLSYQWGQWQEGYLEKQLYDNCSGYYLTTNIDPDKPLTFLAPKSKKEIEFSLHLIPQFVWVDFTTDFFNYDPRSDLAQSMIDKGNEYLESYITPSYFAKHNDSMEDRAVDLMNLSFNRIPTEDRSTEEKIVHLVLNASNASTNEIIDGILNLNGSKYKGKTKKLLNNKSGSLSSLQANLNDKVIDLAIEAHTNIKNDLTGLNPVVISEKSLESTCDLFSAAGINKDFTCTISKNS